MRIATGVVLALALLGAAAPPVTAGEEPASPPRWFHIGALRIRDLTPFGILRLDFLPAHAVTAQTGSWAFEVNLSYQNTYVLSDNVAEYFRAKGMGHRVQYGPADVAAIAAFPDDAYIMDGELGVFDLTAHYRFSPNWGFYVTLPVLVFQSGFLDSTIENFHDLIGVGTANRDLVKQDQFFMMTKTRAGIIAITSPPKDGIMDPVIGARYTAFTIPEKWNAIVEMAIKPAFRDASVYVSSGETDYGLQVSFQRFFRRQALYLSTSIVRFGGVNLEGISDDTSWIPTGIFAYEFKIKGHVNGIMQLYASPSVVRDTDLKELKATKYLASLGIQAERKSWFYRFALTENVFNFENTADIAVTFSIAKAFKLPFP